MNTNPIILVVGATHKESITSIITPFEQEEIHIKIDEILGTT